MKKSTLATLDVREGADPAIINTYNSKQQNIIKTIPPEQNLTITQLHELLNIPLDVDYARNVKIDPIIAKRILSANNEFNRDINDKHVKLLAEQIANKAWNDEGVSVVAFSKYGDVTDGQHRLSAIVKSNIGIYADVKFNVEQRAGIDTNRPRVFEDNIILDSRLDRKLQILAGIAWRSNGKPYFKDKKAERTFKKALSYFKDSLRIAKGGTVDKSFTGPMVLSQDTFLRLVNKHKDIIEKFVSSNLMRTTKNETGKQAMINYFYASYFLALNAGVPIDVLLTVDEAIKQLPNYDQRNIGIANFGAKYKSEKDATGSRLPLDRIAQYIKGFQYIINEINNKRHVGVKKLIMNKPKIVGGFDSNTNQSYNPDFIYADDKYTEI